MAASQNQVQENRWLAVLDALPDLLFELDADGRYLDYHSPRSDLLAAPAEHFLGKTFREVLPKAAADIGMTTLHEAALHGYSHGHQVELKLADGPRWFEFSVSRKINGPDQPVTFIMLSRDITHRKTAELKVERLTRLYAALSQCNQAIVRCQGEVELFAILCRNAVNFGGMKMAWFGKFDVPAQRVVPVAWYGEGTHYLDGIQITLDPGDPSGRGPAGTAMRENRPVWCQDFQNNPATVPWHAQARQYGWGAAAGLPLHLRGQVVGVFMVYAAEVDAFDDDARALLLEMVMDIDYALDRFADEVERKQVQDQLRDSEERYRKAFQTSPDAVTISRMADSVCLDVNLGFERLTGWRHDEVVGRTAAQIGVWHAPVEQQRMRDALQREGRCSNMEADFVKKDGSLLHGLISAERVRFNEVDCVLTITRDITEKKRSDAQIERLAHFDQLTGLPNRAQLQERFQFALSLAQRSGEGMALMFLDLDHFKNVNDTLGHSVGDQLLVEVSRRLTSVLRVGDTLSRMGGDEFILLLPAIDEEGASQVALKLIDALARPCQIEHHELISTCSIGIALYPQDGEDFETLSKNADAAMYRVKNASRNNYCFFTREMQAHSARSLQLVNAMHHALARGEFLLHYQPQLSLQDGRVVGVEALLRWQHPEFGMMSPAEFIPIAESSGQILAIGEWVLRTAVTQLKCWLDAGMRPMVVAVNLSAVQFRDPHLPDLVTRILQEVGLAPHCLELELTEASTMDDPVAAVTLMNQLHERGVLMAMDDFGTGYSSLSHLKKFSVYKLKIDQSFVRDIGNDPDDKAIVTAIINLASSLGLKTIAEGVETAEQLAFLRLQGCDEVQGYYFSKPLPADQLAAFVRQPPAFG
ncbi:EAL domain-containing protein [Rhodoferax sp.]|uniref:bifunctional diguanylate cyclase/phosphodiesterase n=1 Tax=Rhodoferax sp. TaxID=50421 RepID=UPI00261ED059|nr:EAL domain-containing protein [Rhodoferax sp.]MDD2926155.1 EAL domain-containing protein [Rhodoferax sp.]